MTEILKIGKSVLKNDNCGTPVLGFASCKVFKKCFHDYLRIFYADILKEKQQELPSKMAINC